MENFTAIKTTWSAAASLTYLEYLHVKKMAKLSKMTVSDYVRSKLNLPPFGEVRGRKINN